jgi:tetratricopeptide (TPR) repeat protein
MPDPRAIEWVEGKTVGGVPRARAIANLRALVATQPGRFEPRLMLARLLIDDNRPADVADLLAAAPPELAGAAALLLGRAARHLGEAEDAVALLRAAAEGDDREAPGELAQALMQAGRADDALHIALEHLARRPFDVACQRVAGTILIDRGRGDDAMALCRDLQSRGVRGAQIVWTTAFAARASGDAALLGREPWFAQKRLALDDDALAHEILDDAMRAPSQTYKPTKGRISRIYNFDGAPGPAARALHIAVRAEIERYAAERAGHAEHPLIAAWPKRLMLESWALAMAGDGYEDWHIHGHAWLSAVYYVRNPARGLGGDAGRFGVGLMPAATRWAGRTFEPWQVTPEPGLLVIFPAWYAHRTWPTGKDGERISVAFNAIAA